MKFNDSEDDFQKSPLVEQDTKLLLENLQKKYLNFNKIFNKMKIYYDKLDELTRTEYDDIKDEM